MLFARSYGIIAWWKIILFMDGTNMRHLIVTLPVVLKVKTFDFDPITGSEVTPEHFIKSLTTAGNGKPAERKGLDSQVMLTLVEQDPNFKIDFDNVKAEIDTSVPAQPDLSVKDMEDILRVAFGVEPK